jgi:hypothetical protein
VNGYARELGRNYVWKRFGKTPPEMPTMPQAKNSKRKLLNTKHPKPKFPKQGSQAKTPAGRIPDERSQTKDLKRRLASEEPHFKAPKRNVKKNPRQGRAGVICFYTATSETILNQSSVAQTIAPDRVLRKCERNTRHRLTPLECWRSSARNLMSFGLGSLLKGLPPRELSV